MLPFTSSFQPSTSLIPLISKHFKALQTKTFNPRTHGRLEPTGTEYHQVITRISPGDHRIITGLSPDYHQLPPIITKYHQLSPKHYERRLQTPSSAVISG